MSQRQIGWFSFAFVVVGLASGALVGHWAATTPADRLAVFAEVAQILSVVAIGFGFYTYFGQRAGDRDGEKRRHREARRTSIKAIQDQVDAVGWWASGDGDGYKMEEADAWRSNQEPYRLGIAHAIYKVNISFLEQFNLLPGIADLEDETVKSVTWVVQYATSFNYYLDLINQFRTTTAAEALKKKFLGKKLSKEDVLVLDKLMDMYVWIHFQIIGCDEPENTRLHFWYKNLKRQLTIEQAKLQT